MEKSEVDILLIEDNPYEAELTIRSLQQQHIANRLMHIDDGAEAVDFIFSNIGINHSFNPKVILLDLKLPKVDGLEILKRLKTDARTQHIPVVVLTSSKEESDIVESYKLGANSFLVKPVSFESFARSISELGFYWLVLNTNPDTNRVNNFKI